MAVTFTQDGTGTGTNIDDTGESVSLPNDTKVVELYLSADGFYKKGAHDSSDFTWMPVAASVWTTIRGIDSGVLGIKASTGSTLTAYVDVLNPIDVKQGR